MKQGQFSTTNAKSLHDPVWIKRLDVDLPYFFSACVLHERRDAMRVALYRADSSKSRRIGPDIKAARARK